jgi:hypothetical protein
VRHFWLRRNEDLTGISGTGIVAEGNIFSNGTAIMHWLSKESTFETFEEIEQVTRLHGHNGRSEVVYDLQNELQR